MYAKLAAVLAVLLLAPPVHAHLDAGEDVAAGSYVLDFGYSPAEPSTDDRTTISLAILDADGKAVAADSVWVRISSGSDVLFAGSLYPGPGGALFAYRFPEPGTYSIRARFSRGSEVLAENDFEILIGGGKKSPGIADLRVIFYVAALALLAFVVLKSKLLNLPKIGKKS